MPEFVGGREPLTSVAVYGVDDHDILASESGAKTTDVRTEPVAINREVDRFGKIKHRYREISLSKLSGNAFCAEISSERHIYPST